MKLLISSELGQGHGRRYDPVVADVQGEVELTRLRRMARRLHHDARQPPPVLDVLNLILANKLVKAVPRGHTCCWSVTSTSSRWLVPARCCVICSPRPR